MPLIQEKLNTNGYGYWKVDGTDLQTLAYNISTWGGDRQAPPPWRGDDLQVPYMPGRRRLDKVMDSRTMTLTMWVVGMNTDGSIPADQRQQFEYNYRALRSLLWTPGRQFSLSKILVVDGVDTTVTALAETLDGLDPTMFGRLRAEFEADINLADPLFYGPAVALAGAGSYTILGEAPTTHVRVTLAAGATLSQTQTGISIQNKGSASVTVDVATGRKTDGTVAPVKRTGGRGPYFPLNPGALTLTGSGSVSYNPAYL